MDDIFTSNGKDQFLVYDNHKENRIIGFFSEVGVLSESKHYHSDGTFHTKSKYFGQLYVIHAFFPPKEFKDDDTVWVKRMIPCAWFFMKRRRTKDYVQVIVSLIEACKKLNLVIAPNYVMIDFELAAMNAFEKCFTNIIVKGCLFILARRYLKI